MKKQTRHGTQGDKPEKKKTVNPVQVDQVVEVPDANDDLQEEQLKRLSEIESTEVATEADNEVSIDPDKLVTICKPKPEQPHIPWWKRRRVIGSVAAGAAVIVILLAVPLTRFFLLGWAWRENVTITVVDASTHTPVTDARVSLGGKYAVTDGSGRVVLPSIGLGMYTLQIEKPLYRAASIALSVDVFSSSQQRQQSLIATGRPQTFRVIDRLTDKPIAEATIMDEKGEVIARTNTEGKATVVIPTENKELDVSIGAGEYRQLATTITSDTNQLRLIPSGALYFLSKQSDEKINVVKSNLDGSDAKIIVAGTGSEVDDTTVLLPSRDWKYLLLKAKRAPNKPESLFVIDTSNNTMKLVDEGALDFRLIGWSGHYFTYEASQTNNRSWQAKQTAIKSYNAETDKLAVVDENANDAASDENNMLYEVFSNYHIYDDRLVYAKVWSSSASSTLSREGRQSMIVSVKPDGSDKKTVQAFAAAEVNSIHSQLELPHMMSFKIGDRSTPTKYTYGQLGAEGYKTIAHADVDRTYPVYMISPSGTYTLWSEKKDGKNSIFMGDKHAGGKQELVANKEQRPYGWLGDEYILLQDDYYSGLYITTKAQLQSGGEPLKVGGFSKWLTQGGQAKE